ncbi:MAG: FTR1 family protein [Rhodoferax sp.]|uniref:FTR1 family protein n=1 Tax=Rhodoferax sp. TaxID=50421 RepID=UPI003017EDA4
MLITFREGLEAFLMVAVATLYLRKTGRHALINAVRTGLGVSIAGSIALGVVMAKIGASSPMWEGVLALLAATAVIWCVSHMLKMGKQMGREISDGIGKASVLDGAQAWWSVFIFTLFMVGREGVESAAMLSSLAANSEMYLLLVGGLVGLISAATIALLWTKYGRQVNLTQFFNVTAVFMLAFAAMLLLKGFFEFTEVNLIPGINNAYWHDLTEAYVEGDYAQIFSVMLVLAPTLWLVATYWLDLRRNRSLMVSPA